MLRERIFQLGGWRFWSVAVVWTIIGWYAVPIVWYFHLWSLWWVWLRWGNNQISETWLLVASVLFGLQFAVLSGWLLGFGVLVALLWLLSYRVTRLVPIREWQRDWLGVVVMWSLYQVFRGALPPPQIVFLNITIVGALLLVERLSRRTRSL